MRCCSAGSSRSGHQARRLYLEPDAGPWEYRGRQRIHTHSATMCWVACDRLARLAGLLALDERAGYWRAHADKIRNEILRARLERQVGSFVGALDHDDLDASALLRGRARADLGATTSAIAARCDVIGKELSRNGFIMRYTAEDDFGAPETAFLVCQFWYADALASIGATEKARDIFTDVLSRRNSLRNP